MFRALKIFPFCVPTDDPTRLDELDAEDRAGAEYTGGYAGTNYPVRLSLAQATRLFWRTRQIDFVVSMSVDTTYGPVTNEVVTPALDPGLPATKLAAFTSRVCEGPRYLRYEMLQTSSLSTESSTGELLWFGGGDYVSRCIREFAGGDPTNDNNYFYLPHIRAVFAGYDDLWATFWPHFTREVGDNTVYSTTGESRTLTLNFGDDSVPFDIYRITLNTDRPDPEEDSSSGSGSATLSDWEVELW